MRKRVRRIVRCDDGVCYTSIHAPAVSPAPSCAEEPRVAENRHTFASGGLLVGKEWAIIGKLLGHMQVQTTERNTNLAPDLVKQAATKRYRIAWRWPCSVQSTDPNAKRPQRSQGLIDNAADESEYRDSRCALPFGDPDSVHCLDSRSYRNLQR